MDEYSLIIRHNYLLCAASTMTALHVLLFLLYAVALSFLIKRNKSHAVIPRNAFVVIFLARILAGIVYGYIYSRPAYVETSDAWRIFSASLNQYNLLLHDPWEFLRSSFIFKGDISLTNFTQTESSYWNILKEVLLVKFEALFNVFSFGNYYVNVVLYNFLMMQASFAFFKTLERNFAGRSSLNLFSAFLIPSVVFWTSAVYKDGLLMALMFVICWQTQQFLDQGKKTTRFLLIVIPCLAVLFFLRTYCAFLIIPALSGWIACEKLSASPGKVFGFLYALAFIFVVLTTWAYPELNPLKVISSWQQAFIELTANSSLPAKPLKPTVGGLISNFPQSFNFAYLRPLLWENKGLQYLAFAMELFILQALLIYMLIKRAAGGIRWSGFTMFSLFLSLSGLLFIGYTVNIIGALVRYRCIYLPFLFAAVLGTLPDSIINRIYLLRRYR